MTMMTQKVKKINLRNKRIQTMALRKVNQRRKKLKKKSHLKTAVLRYAEVLAGC